MKKGATLDEIPLKVKKTRQFDKILFRHCNTVYNQNPIDGRRNASPLTYLQRLSADIGCSLEGLPEVIDDREGWREKVSDIPADGATWWWIVQHIVRQMKKFLTLYISRPSWKAVFSTAQVDSNWSGSPIHFTFSHWENVTFSGMRYLKSLKA